MSTAPRVATLAVACLALSLAATAAPPDAGEVRDALVRNYALSDRVATALSAEATRADAMVRTGSGRVAPGFEPPTAPDLDPDPSVVEVVLVALPTRVSYDGEHVTAVWSYNGSVPGPTIEAEIGDTLVVHFLNLLPEGTTVHWHGLELPAEMDGSHISQDPVPPTGYFRYEFRLLRAATFWYHPHVRTNEQVEKGLHGALVVRDPAEDAAFGLPRHDHVVVLDDVLLDADGEVEPAYPDDPVARAEMQLNGREGNVLLVNGRARTAPIQLRRGIPHRMRFINASNSRFMRISVPGHTLWQIGNDAGLLESPIEIPPIERIPDPHDPDHMISDPDRDHGLLLTPAQRADVVVTPTGDDLHLEWHDTARGRHTVVETGDGGLGIEHAHHDGRLPPVTMLTARLFGPEAPSAWQPPPVLRSIDRIVPSGGRVLTTMFGHAPPSADGEVVFFAQMKDGAPLPFDAVTAEDAPTVAVGETVLWEVHNMTGGDHNFHLHGFHFQLVETEFVDLDDPDASSVVTPDRLWELDTVVVPRRPGERGRSRTIVRLAVTFDDTGREGRILAAGKAPAPGHSGGWLFHCHILEHSNRGMMSFLQIAEE